MCGTCHVRTGLILNQINCKPFGGPPTLSGPWTLHLGPFLDLKLRPWVYLQGILGGLEGYLCPPWGILIYPGSILGLFCDGLISKRCLYKPYAMLMVCYVQDSAWEAITQESL